MTQSGHWETRAVEGKSKSGLEFGPLNPKRRPAWTSPSGLQQITTLVRARICYEGFRTISERYGFPPTFPSVEVATQRVGGFIRHPSIFGVVAEAGGRRIIGFNFLSERDPIRAVGPIVIDPRRRGTGWGVG